MNKPTPKKEVGVLFASKAARHIRFNSTEDAVTEFLSFGKLTIDGRESYSLFVDSRYDFDEVLAYIQNYG